MIRWREPGRMAAPRRPAASPRLERVRVQLTDLLGTTVDLTVEPILKERFRSPVEEDLVRAF
jgi:predicted nucleotidyltransferase